MNPSRRLVFFGNERLSSGLGTTLPVITGLVQAGYDIAAIVVAQKPPAKSRKSQTLEIVEFAHQRGIPLLAPFKLADAADDLAALGAHAAVLVAYGKIVPSNVIELFPGGIINLHPSLLPRHRGPTPLESVILAGEHETGVSLMQLTPKMDAGPVYAQETVLLKGDETKQQLAMQLGALGRDMLLDYLPQILDGRLQPTPQNDSEATYDQLLSKDLARLDFNKPAEQLEREIRAYAGWPRSRTLIGGREVIITSAHVGDAEGTPGVLWALGGQIGFYTSKGSLVLDTGIPSNQSSQHLSPNFLQRGKN